MIDATRLDPTDTARRIGKLVTGIGTTPYARRRVTFDRPPQKGGVAATVLQELNAQLLPETLDDDALDRMSPDEVMALLIDHSPEMNRAVWDLTRLFLAGYEIKVYNLDTKVPHEPGQLAIDLFMDNLSLLYGSAEVPLTRLVMGFLIRGALFAEIVFDSDGRTPIDLATPDPALVRFREKTDSVRGDIWEMGQMVEGEFKLIDSPFVRYVPFDPFPGKPYGRSPLVAGIGPCLFLLSLMRDIKRVVRQQGYPRFDISVDVEQLDELIAKGNFADEDELVAVLVEAVDAALNQVAQQYQDLTPDSAFVHSSLVTINGIVGAIDAGTLSTIDTLITAVERQATRAMKMMPLLMGISETADESDANRQWEIMVKGVKAMQHRCETMLEYLFSMGLQAQGIVADVEVRFAELRVAEAMRDTQVDQLKTATAERNERLGYMTADEASIYAVGHPIPDDVKAEREPLLNKDGNEDVFGQTSPDTPDAGDTAQTEPDPAENRSARRGRSRSRTAYRPLPLPGV